jgi:hypothetical protein
MQALRLATCLPLALENHIERKEREKKMEKKTNKLPE